MVEQRPEKAQVGGSTPSGATIHRRLYKASSEEVPRFRNHATTLSVLNSSESQTANRTGHLFLRP